MSALRAGRLYLLLITVTLLSRHHGYNTIERNTSMNNSNDTIEDRTRDLPACSAVPQPTAPPCAPVKRLVNRSFVVMLHSVDTTCEAGTI